MPALAQSAPHVTFYLAVVALSLIARRGPAILVMVSGAFAAVYLFVEPRFSLRPHTLEDFVWLGFHGLVCGTIIAAIESRTMAAWSAKERPEALEAEQRKRAEAERERDQQQRWSVQTLSSIGDAAITTNAGGQTAFINRVAAELTAWGFSEAVG